MRGIKLDLIPYFNFKGRDCMIPDQTELKYAQMKYAKYYKIYDIVTVVFICIILIIPLLIACALLGADTQTGFIKESLGDLIMLDTYAIIAVAGLRKAIISALWQAYDDIKRIESRE